MRVRYRVEHDDGRVQDLWLSEGWSWAGGRRRAVYWWMVDAAAGTVFRAAEDAWTAFARCGSGGRDRVEVCDV